MNDNSKIIQKNVILIKETVKQTVKDISKIEDLV